MNRKILDFISETGMLKRLHRSGWSVLGIKDAESIADHSFRCAIIGYILAYVEKASPHRVTLMTLFNDLHEARITDLHKMAQRYIKVKDIEDRAFYDQIESLPRKIQHELYSIRREYRLQRTRESIVARDADILECLLQAKEYKSQGYSEASKFMRRAPAHLKTKAAKELWHLAKNADLNKWWYSLSTFAR